MKTCNKAVDKKQNKLIELYDSLELFKTPDQSQL